MKVILTQNVAGIGKIDDIKEVSEGYARNFLFSRNLAQPASSQVLADLQARKNKQAKDEQRGQRDLQSLMDRLTGYVLSLKEKVGPSNNLYAAVGPQKVAEALFAKGFNINKEQVFLQSIKQPGQYQAKIKLKNGLETEINLIVSKI
jgi:large subunit ribosomal protein L9